MSNKKELPAWDLSDLYQGIDDIKVQTDITKVKDLSVAFADDYKGKVATLNTQEFLKSIQRYEEIDILCGRLMEYAFLQMCTRMEDAAAMGFYQNTNEQVCTPNIRVPKIFHQIHLS